MQLESGRPSPRFERLDRVVRNALGTFAETYLALQEIRNKRLYAHRFGTFEDYCRHRFAGIGARRANQLMQAAHTMRSLAGIEDNSLPENERQLRALARAPEERRSEIWQRAVDSAPNNRPTAKLVERIVDQDSEDRGETIPPPSRASDEFYTPHEYADAARELMGGIDLDPCSTPEANLEYIKATRIYTIDHDGLSQLWEGRVWLNSPMNTREEDNESAQAIWTSRLISHHQTGRVPQACALVQANTSDQWFRKLWEHPLCFLHQRLKFYIPGCRRSPHHARAHHAIMYLGEQRDRFGELFSPYGRCVLPAAGGTSEVR